jgi:hypothetical protein
MGPESNPAALEKTTRESVQTYAEKSSQEEPLTTADGTAFETALDAVGVDVMTAEAPSIGTPTQSEKGDKVTRQMSPNLITAPAFHCVSDFVDAYETTDKTIFELTEKFVDAADEAKQKQDEIVPYLAYMQSLFSKKGRNHHFVQEARKTHPDIPWWSDYYKKYKNQLWESLRTMERRIDAYRKDPSVSTNKSRNGRNDKPKYLTQLEHRLLGTATTVHEALTDINAGRIDDAVKKLKENLPTQDRIEEYLQCGVRPTLAIPEGDLKRPAGSSQQQPNIKERIEPPPALPASAPVSQAAGKKWCNLSLWVTDAVEEEILLAWGRLGKKEATRLIVDTLKHAAKAVSPEVPKYTFPVPLGELQELRAVPTKHAETVEAGTSRLTFADGEPL